MPGRGARNAGSVFAGPRSRIGSSRGTPRAGCSVAGTSARTLQQTVADIVSAESVGSVLTRRSPRLRTVSPHVGPLRHAGCSSDLRAGLQEPAAERIASDLLLVGADDTTIGQMVVDVASAPALRQVAVIDSPTALFLGDWIASTHARLAAPALIAAALAAAKQDATTAKALLELSTALATIVTVEEVATKLKHGAWWSTAMPRWSCSSTPTAQGPRRCDSRHLPRVGGTALCPRVRRGERVQPEWSGSTTRRRRRRSSNTLAVLGAVAALGAHHRQLGRSAARGCSQRRRRLAPPHQLPNCMRPVRLRRRSPTPGCWTASPSSAARRPDGSPNRVLILDRVESMLSCSLRHPWPCCSSTSTASSINDTFGHTAATNCPGGRAAGDGTCATATPSDGSAATNSWCSSRARVSTVFELVCERLLPSAEPFEIDDGVPSTSPRASASRWATAVRRASSARRRRRCTRPRPTARTASSCSRQRCVAVTDRMNLGWTSRCARTDSSSSSTSRSSR